MEASVHPSPPKSPVGWRPIKNLIDQKVMAIAKFAVKTYNAAYPHRDPLTLVRIDSGEVLVDVGAIYHLYIAAAGERIGFGRYQTFVFEYPSGKWDLLSFVQTGVEQ
ncbi:Cysteine proteinase inhibitor 6 [Linum perenne]